MADTTFERGKPRRCERSPDSNAMTLCSFFTKHKNSTLGGGIAPFARPATPVARFLAMLALAPL